MSDEWLRRVEEEHAQLAERIVKLEAFLVTPVFESLSAYEKSLLHFQLQEMSGYYGALSRRLAFYSKHVEMKAYVCHKEVLARPMTREDYNTLRGWTVPDDENPADEGYLVEYQDGGKPNHPGFKGYISWSPKEVFEKGYTVISND